MSVLIKGMEMPKSCDECCLAFHFGMDKLHCNITGKTFDVWEVGWGSKDNHGENGQRPYIRHDDCPLVELPAQHGRLIDGDELTKMCHEMQGIEWNNNAAPYSWAYAYESFENDIDEAPTIIEAEVSE